MCRGGKGSCIHELGGGGLDMMLNILECHEGCCQRYLYGCNWHRAN